MVAPNRGFLGVNKLQGHRSRASPPKRVPPTIPYTSGFRGLRGFRV